MKAIILALLVGNSGILLPPAECVYEPVNYIDMRAPIADIPSICRLENAVGCVAITLRIRVVPLDVHPVLLADIITHENAHLNCGQWQD